MLLAAGLLFLSVLFTYAGSAWAAVLYRLLTDGPLLLLWLGAMLGAGALVSKLFKWDGEHPGFATSAALGIGFFCLLLFSFAWTGVLNRSVAWISVGRAVFVNKI